MTIIMKGLHQEKSLENLKQLFGRNAPSRTQDFFCLFVWFVVVVVLMNLDEAGGVSVTSTGAAHQRLTLQTSTQRKK